MQVLYVYPNVSGISQRGGLLEHWELAKINNCEFIEIPADFIKKKTEIKKKTGQNLGEFLKDESIKKIYSKQSIDNKLVKYILHTEPSLPRNDGFGLRHQAALKWYDEDWINKFIKMNISISKHFGIPPYGIENHPGDKRNTFKDLKKSICLIIESFFKEFNQEPIILLENRTGQFISNGKQITDFWNSLLNSDLQDKVGIILDIQQLYTVTRNKFVDELEIIPLESIKGFHIHHKHRLPTFEDEIPWRIVFREKINKINGGIIINPEIHHKNKVKAVIDFCEMNY